MLVSLPRVKICEVCGKPVIGFFDLHIECCEKEFGHEWCKHGCERCGISQTEHWADAPDPDDRDR